MIRKIAVIEIPHQTKARLYWYYDQKEFIDAVADIAFKNGEPEINTFEDAQTYLVHLRTY